MPENHNLLSEMSKIAALALRANRSAEFGRDRHATREILREAVALTKPWLEAVAKHLEQHGHSHGSRERSGDSRLSKGGLLTMLANFAVNKDKSKKDGGSWDSPKVLREMSKLLGMYLADAEEEIETLGRKLKGSGREDGRRRRKRTEEERELGQHIGKRERAERAENWSARSTVVPADSSSQVSSWRGGDREVPVYHEAEHWRSNAGPRHYQGQAASVRSSRRPSAQYSSPIQQPYSDKDHGLPAAPPPPPHGVMNPANNPYGDLSGQTGLQPGPHQAPYPSDRSSQRSSGSSRVSMPQPQAHGARRRDPRGHLSAQHGALPVQQQYDTQDFAEQDQPPQSFTRFANGQAIHAHPLAHAVSADHTGHFGDPSNTYQYGPPANASGQQLPLNTAAHSQDFLQDFTPYENIRTAQMPRAPSVGRGSVGSGSHYTRQTRAPTVGSSVGGGHGGQDAPIIPDIHVQPPSDDRPHSARASATANGAPGSRRGPKKPKSVSSETESIPRTSNPGVDNWVRSQSQLGQVEEGEEVEDGQQSGMNPNFNIPGVHVPSTFHDTHVFTRAEDVDVASVANGARSTSGLRPVDVRSQPWSKGSQRSAKRRNENVLPTMPEAARWDFGELPPQPEFIGPHHSDARKKHSRTASKTSSSRSHRSQRRGPGPLASAKFDFEGATPEVNDNVDRVSEIVMGGYQKPQKRKICHHLPEDKVDPEYCKSLSNSDDSAA